MTLTEFINETRRIEQFYDKELNDVQRDEWYKNLKNIAIEKYRQIINVSMERCKFLPKLADILEIQRTLNYEKKQEKQIIKCSKCNSTGYLIYKKTIKNGDRNLKYDYACVCTCGNAKKYEGWNIQDKEHSSDFYTPLEVELGIS